MKRFFSHGGVVAVLLALVGCGGNDRDSIIQTTTNQIALVSASVSNIKTKIDDFLAKKAKQPADEEGAKKDLEDAVGEAKKLKDTAFQLQALNRQADSMAPSKEEEKKALLEKFKSRINTVEAELVNSHREMTKVLREATKKYEEQTGPLAKALSEAEADFVAISRRK